MQKMAKLELDEDTEAYLTTFERIDEGLQRGGGKLAVQIGPNLTGKAQQAFAALDAEKAMVCRKEKAAILRLYNQGRSQR